MYTHYSKTSLHSRHILTNIATCLKAGQMFNSTYQSVETKG